MSIKNGHDYPTYGKKPNVIPLYESGLAGLPLILEISMIIPIIHISGMIPVLRILFNSEEKIVLEIDHSETRIAL
jgi:uncharacterized membrane protein YhdT